MSYLLYVLPPSTTSFYIVFEIFNTLYLISGKAILIASTFRKNKNVGNLDSLN